jgi:hypothetical protein
MFGIDDPWIWGAYLACFATVAFCCIYGWLKKDDDDDDGDA